MKNTEYTGGSFQKVGCDWLVDSDATEDRCGICHGDGTQCETTSGVYDKNDGQGYKEVVMIPFGSRNIKIEEIGNSKNYIGIGVPNSDKYFLNGKRCVRMPLVVRHMCETHVETQKTWPREWTCRTAPPPPCG